MPGFLLHVGATVMCSHGGQATPMPPPVPPLARVLVSGMPVLTIANLFTVAGCPFVAPGGNGPCVSALWTIGATRVFVDGAPALLTTGCLSVCAPTGTPLLPVTAQTKVSGI
jgi:hypothetical protein